MSNIFFSPQVIILMMIIVLTILMLAFTKNNLQKNYWVLFLNPLAIIGQFVGPKTNKAAVVILLGLYVFNLYAIYKNRLKAKNI
ncbi:hypothetical protein BG262_06375 [Floricoccus penangensis]|uniref:Uncharacterized protein n=1 Tax=Floricoccus penangensis TaxID=1859475 RepID=A0A9Q5P0B2_9LACT|nr:hypothetical protein [Floricoccus penangensis]OFI46106.1 hypothetical protein BG262_06375 [Floricoccus penangensis]